MKRVTGPTGALAVADGGSGGLPVVFVHSLGGNVGHWGAQLAHVRRGRRALALDLRGHGRSEPPAGGDYSVEAMARDVAGAVDAVGIGRFALVGHSLGGAAALACAGSRRERVAGLLLVDPNGDARAMASELRGFLEQLDSPDYERVVAEYWRAIAGPDPRVRERLLRDLRDTPRRTVVESFKAVLRYDPHPALARYRGPALSLVTPANDMPWSLHRLGRGIPHEVVRGTGHWLHLDRPEEFNRRMDRFLAGLDAAG